MSKVNYDKDNMVKSVFDIEKFKLKMNEVARVVLIEQQLDMENRHWVETGQDKGGYYICLGRDDTIRQNGTDPEQCPLCSKASDSGIVSMPRRYFVTQIIKYITNAKGEPVTPLAADVLPWIFSNDKYNDLTMKKDVHGDLRAKDLVIKCTGEQYQKMQIEVAPAIWLKDETTKNNIVAVFKANKLPDVVPLLGRRLSKEELDKLIADLFGGVGAGVGVDAAAAADVAAGLEPGGPVDMNASLGSEVDEVLGGL